MSQLSDLFSSDATAEVLRQLFSGGHRPVHLREMARRASLAESTLRRELKRFQDLELITFKRGSNRIYYEANTNHPLYRDLHGLAAKTVGIRWALKQYLYHKNVDLVLAHGSELGRIEEAGCPITLLVIGWITPSLMRRMLAVAAQDLNRRITVNVISDKEFRRRLRAGDTELSDLLAGPLILLYGFRHRLKELRGTR